MVKPVLTVIIVMHPALFVILVLGARINNASFAHLVRVKNAGIAMIAAGYVLFARRVNASSHWIVRLGYVLFLVLH
jgi:type IV secretory pathway TrbL component